MDQFRGLYSNTPPRHQLLDPPSHSILNRGFVSSGSNLLRFHIGELLSNEFIAIVGKIQRLMLFVEFCKNVPVSPPDWKAFYDEREWVENRIILLIANSSADDSKLYEHCVYLAASLYHHTVPRPLCIWSGIHSTIVDKLKRALLRTRLASFWHPHQELLLWILMTAAPACIEGQTKRWYLELLKSLLFSCFPNWNIPRIKEILRDFLCMRRYVVLLARVY